MTLDELFEVPVVVTASRHEEKISDVPYAISVITDEDIRLSGARSVPDALRLVPGVDVAQLAFNNAAVSPRGFHSFFSSRTLVLVDGRQIYDAVFGGTIWGGWPFQLDDIERIEVIRGPGGATWGADAVNGVINIITKDPADQLGTTLDLSAGSRGTHKEHLGYATVDGKLRLRISAEYEMTDGFQRGGARGAPVEDDSLTGRAGFHAIYEAAPNDRWTFSGGSAVVDGGYPHAPLSSVKPANPGSQGSYLLAVWDHDIDARSAFDLTAYVNDFGWEPRSGASEYRYQQLAVLAGHTLKVRDTAILRWGIDTRVDHFDGSHADPPVTSKGSVNSARAGAYIQDEWHFAPKWTLHLGGRIDYESYSGFDPSARAALAFRRNDKSMIYGAVTRGVQIAAAPTRFLRTPQFGGIAVVTGDRSGESNALLAYELGLRSRPHPRLQTDVALYWHEYEDIGGLRARLGPPGLITLEGTDVGAASSYGAELALTYAATERLQLLGSYTYERLDWRGPGAFPLVADAMTPPEHKLTAGARYRIRDDLRVAGHLYYVDEVDAPDPHRGFRPQEIDAYVRLDLRMEKDLWDDQAMIAAGVRDLLDPHHPEGASGFFNDAEVPRMVYVEFRMTIK
jgi:iron complex outermembrane receptor protein